MLNISKNKQTLLFLLLAALFITNALMAEFIGVKIFSLEKSFGIRLFDINFLGMEHLSFNLTAGVLLWPIVFILTDIINEYYGTKGVKFLSYLTSVMIAYAFIVVKFAINLSPADFWPKSHLALQPQSEVLNLNSAYSLIFGQGLWIIIGSLVAFLIGQIIDVYVFHKIKESTGESRIWLRSTGSTLVSQFIDSYVVLVIAFYIGAGWPLKMVLAIGTINYIYKFFVAILMTPVIYLVHDLIERFLGHELASKMKTESLLTS
ncbi:MAG: queuosine precursor transporter [Saprospiraceae bacterium]